MRRAVGPARIVLLGEVSHGDGAAFLAKGRLVRFLHQRLGFDVLVWESPFYACFSAGGRHPVEKDSLRIEEAVMSIWSGSRQCAPAFDYIRSTWGTDRPISLVGLSPYVFANDPLYEDLKTFFRRADPSWPTEAQRDALDALREYVEGAAERPRPAIRVAPPQEPQLRELIRLIDEDPDGRIAKAHGRKHAALMRLALENLIAYAEALHRPLSRGGADDTVWCRQEGANLLFWARDYFPDRRLVVWAHNGHIIRNAGGIEELGANYTINELTTAGDHAHGAWREGVYSMMFLTHGGERALWWDKPRAISPPAGESLEAMFHEARWSAAFLDLRQLSPDHWLREMQVASPVEQKPMRTRWPQSFDGIVYIDTMTPSTGGL